MKNKKLIEIPNLAEIPFSHAKELAKAVSRLTNEDMSERTRIPIETIRRYFKDPTYNPSPSKIPLLCKVLGNTIMIEWQAVQTDGIYIPNYVKSATPNLEILMANLTKEFSDVIREDGKARLDRVYSDEEYSALEKELFHLEKSLQEMKQFIKKNKPRSARREHGQNI